MHLNPDELTNIVTKYNWYACGKVISVATAKTIQLYVSRHLFRNSKSLL